MEAEEALAQAQWNLEQTRVEAPADGVVTALSLRPGNRVTTMRSAVNFVVPDDRILIASLPQSSYPNVSVGDKIRVALGTMPGSEFEATIASVPAATDEGTLDTRTGLPTLREVGGISSYIVTMQVPEGAPADAARLGASGTALVITENAGAISALAEILFWFAKMTNYL